MLLPEVVYLVLEALVGHLEVKQPRFQFAPMSNARLNTDIRYKKNHIKMSHTPLITAHPDIT
jgi:hypothetical protein